MLGLRDSPLAEQLQVLDLSFSPVTEDMLEVTRGANSPFTSLRRVVSSGRLPSSSLFVSAGRDELSALDRA